MKLENIKELQDMFCKVIGHRVIDSFTNSKEIIGGIDLKGEFVTITDKDGFETEVHYEEVKEIQVL